MHKRITGNNNPACPHCGGRAWKTKHGNNKTYYKCCECKINFTGELNKVERIPAPACPNCNLHSVTCAGTYTYKGDHRREYKCKNCGTRFTSSPLKGSGNPLLKRTISAKRMLELRIEGLSYGEIAKIAGVTKNAVIAALSKSIVDW